MIGYMAYLGLLLLWALAAKGDPVANYSGPWHGIKPRQLSRFRCVFTQGAWCQEFHSQSPIPLQPTPRGDKECPNNCSSVGQCQHDFGLCDCPAGRKGADCSEMDKRECSNMGQDRRDKEYVGMGWSASRCAGICDDNRAMCWCHKGKFARDMGPADGDPLAPPAQLGRTLTECHMVQTENGTKVPWQSHGHTYEELFGPDGWCNADQPTKKCPCKLDGMGGPFCDEPTEHFCLNQCGGRGRCVYGFCRCEPGWYGQDCTRRRGGLAMEEGPDQQQDAKPWLQDLVIPPLAAQQAPAKTSRLRPLIYVYDMPSKFYRRMLEYRSERTACTWRYFDAHNNTVFYPSPYGVEQLLHELLLQSDHRTFDPEEADFFYVPTYTSCFFWPVHGWAEKPAWPKEIGMMRPMHMTLMLREVQQWLQQTLPYWNRTAGRDHIFLMGHDEGACWAPHDIMNSTLLVHWGRMDMNNQSQTGFWMDVYDSDWKDPELLPDGYLRHLAGHVCYDPVKDLVIPGIKSFSHFHLSPFLGAPHQPRDLLLFWRGDVRLTDPSPLAKRYSRGLRQRARQLAKNGGWLENHKMLIVSRHEHHEPYGLMLARSKFALVLPGDGWSGRMQDAAVHGAIPVVMMDNTHEKFETVLNFSSFALRVAEADLPKLPQILEAIPKERIKAMRRVLAKVWHRFVWLAHPILQRDVRRITLAHLSAAPPPAFLSVDGQHTPANRPRGGERLGGEEPADAEYRDETELHDSELHESELHESELQVGLHGNGSHGGWRGDALDVWGQEFHAVLGGKPGSEGGSRRRVRAAAASGSGIGIDSHSSSSNGNDSGSGSDRGSGSDSGSGSNGGSGSGSGSHGTATRQRQAGAGQLGTAGSSAGGEGARVRHKRRQVRSVGDAAAAAGVDEGEEVAPEAEAAAAEHAQHYAAQQRRLRRLLRGLYLEDDAFGTILQWLHSRIPHVKGRGGGGAGGQGRVRRLLRVAWRYGRSQNSFCRPLG